MTDGSTSPTLNERVTDLEAKLERSRMEARALIGALAVTINAIDLVHPGRKTAIKDSLQNISDNHRKAGEDGVSNSFERLLREI